MWPSLFVLFFRKLLEGLRFNDEPGLLEEGEKLMVTQAIRTASMR